MDAGALDWRVTLLSRTDAADEIGQITSEWTPGLTVWAGRWQFTLKDVERQAGQAQQADGKWLIRARTVTLDMRLRCEGTDHEIIAIEPFENRVGLLLFTRAAQ